MNRRRSVIRAGLATAAVVAIGLMAAACGSSTSSSSSSTPASPAPSTAASSSAGAVTADQAYAQQQLTPLLAMPTFVAPGPAFDAKKVMAGKSIMSIPGTGTDPFYVQINNGMKEAAAAVGYKFSVWNNQGLLTQYQTGLSQAITTKTSLVDLLAGPNPSTLGPQITQAKAAGVIVVSSHLTGIDQKVPYVNYNLPIDYNKAGRLLADWVITKDPTAHVLVLVSDEIVSTATMRAGISSEFAKYGPAIKYSFVNVPIPEWGTKVTPEVQSAIVADPQLTYVICIYDSMAQFAYVGIKNANAVGKVNIVGFNGTPFVIDMVRTGEVQADIGESLGWAGNAIADAEMRIIGGMGEVKSMNIPFRLWTQANAAQAGVPASYSQGYGDYESQYLKLWELQK